MSTEGSVSAAGRAGTSVLVLLGLLTGCSSTLAESPTDETVATDSADATTDAIGDRSRATDVPLDPATRAPQPSSAGADPPEAPTTPRDDGRPAVTTPHTPTTPADVPAATGGTATDACSVPVEPGTPGVTDDEIAVGIPRLRNLAAVLSDAPERDLHEYVQELVDDVNATGGIACRDLRVVWHDVDMSSGTHGPAEEQAMCATWTQDHEVLVAIPGGTDFPYDVLYPCLDRAGVGVIDVRGLSYRDAEAFAKLPRLVNANSPRLDRGARQQVEAHVRQGFLSRATRIGVVYYDEPRTTRTVDGTLIPALETHGLAVAERAPITPPVSTADFAAREREVATAALRFKLAEIDRVLVLRSAGITSNFMNAAERNQYRPRYGLTTVELRVAAFEDAFAVPEAQLVGARGVGWLPDSDLHPRRPQLWPARRACLDFFERRGFPTVTGTDLVLAMAACEAVGFLRASVAAAPPPLSADAVVAGATALGTGYESPLVRRTAFGPSRRDGAATYRDAAYDRECGCFTYTSDPRLLP